MLIHFQRATSLQIQQLGELRELLHIPHSHTWKQEVSRLSFEDAELLTKRYIAQWVEEQKPRQQGVRLIKKNHAINL